MKALRATVAALTLGAMMLVAAPSTADAQVRFYVGPGTTYRSPYYRSPYRSPQRYYRPDFRYGSRGGYYRPGQRYYQPYYGQRYGRGGIQAGPFRMYW
jgi:hypothetical protein